MRDDGRAEPATWPCGDSRMAALIAVHDWGRTTLGSIAGWPAPLRTAVDMVLAMPQPATILWGAQHVQLYNDAYIAIARERHPALLGRPVREGWADVYDDVVAPLLQRAHAGHPTHLSELFVALEGTNGQSERRLFDTDWSPIRDETGAVAGVLQTLVEVTDRLVIRTALRESEARHRVLIESWAQAVWETDADGVVTTDSPSWRAYTGQSEAEWLGYGWLDAIHPDDRAYAERQWREAIAARGLVDAEFRMRRPDGGWNWTNVRAAPVVDATGTIEKWAGMNIDIDARVRSEAALRESEQRYRELFLSMDEAFAVVEVLRDAAGDWSDFRFIEVNPAFMRHTSMPWPVGRTATELLGQLNPRWARLYGQALDTGAPIRVEEDEPVLGRVFDLNIFVLDRTRHRVAVLFSDITARTQADRALRQSEDQLRLVTDAVPALISYMDGELRYRFINKRYEEWFGRTAAELNGRHVRELVGDTAFEILRPHAERALAGHRTVFEAEVPFAPGGTRHVRTDFIPDCRSDGSVAGYYSLVIDLTDRKRMEEDLRRSEARFRALSTAGTSTIYRMSADWTVMFELDGGLLFPTLAARADWLDAYIPPEARADVEAAIAVAVRTGTMFELEHPVQTVGRGLVWVLSRAVPIVGADGEIVEWFGAVHDVSARKAAERALHAEQERLRTLMEGIPQLVWRSRDAGDWTWSGPQWQAFTGQTLEQSRGLGWLDAVHPDDRAAATQAWDRARDTEGIDLEFRVRRAADGAFLWHHTRSVPVRDDAGAITEWIGTTTDVQQLKALQERQAVLVDELQHRTRNLIGVVRSMADKTARASGDFADFRARFRDRLDSLARVQGLLSRLDDIDRVTFDDLVRTELSALHGGLDRVVLDGPAGMRLRSSTVQTLAMALHELATNAVKYGALGQAGGRLAITWSLAPPDARGKPWLHVDWRESGVAMPPAGSAPRGTGQGRDLIERALPYQLRARTSYVLGPDGVHCTISIPVSASTEVPEHG